MFILGAMFAETLTPWSTVVGHTGHRAPWYRPRWWLVNVAWNGRRKLAYTKTPTINRITNDCGTAAAVLVVVVFSVYCLLFTVYVNGLHSYLGGVYGGGCWTERAARFSLPRPFPWYDPPTRPFVNVWDKTPPPAIGGRSGGKSAVCRFASTGRPASVSHRPPGPFCEFRYPLSTAEFLVPSVRFSRNRSAAPVATYRPPGVRAPVLFGLSRVVRPPRPRAELAGRPA